MVQEKNKYEAVEISKNTRNEDWSQVISARWVCDSEYDALVLKAAREVEAEILGRSDSDYEAREDGEVIAGDAPEDDDVYACLVEMGYTDGEIGEVLCIEG